MSDTPTPPQPELDLDAFEGHTPGPWLCETGGAFPTITTRSEEYPHQTVADTCASVAIFNKAGAEENHSEANARLIAAAPTLLTTIRALQAERDRLREALVAHNDLLRSAFAAAQRDAIYGTDGTTNYRLLADRASEVLAKHHAISNEARAALAGSQKGDT